MRRVIPIIAVTLLTGALLLGGGSAATALDDDFEYGYDRPGGDYEVHDIPFQTNTFLTFEKICQNWCHKTGKCHSWTMVKPGIQGRYAKCYLKAGFVLKVKNDCCVSGEIERGD